MVWRIMNQVSRGVLEKIERAEIFTLCLRVVRFLFPHSKIVLNPLLVFNKTTIVRKMTFLFEVKRASRVEILNER